MILHLAKYHGTGNDFLVVDARAAAPPGAQLAARLCDRHRGVGADGLLALLPGGDGADCGMQLRNADGGRAEMSGNGIRCLAAEAVRLGVGAGARLLVDTDAGRRTVTLDVVDSAVRSASVDMGPVTLRERDVEATVHGVTYCGDVAEVGNPHWVMLVDADRLARLPQHGSRLATDERFPAGVNVELVTPGPGSGELTMRVWERGVGETLSCGTGACAAAAVARARGLVGDVVTVHVPGGDLLVELGESVRLGGPVEHVFDVDVPVPEGAA